jgi:hypothetical protein
MIFMDVRSQPNRHPHLPHGANPSNSSATLPGGNPDGSGRGWFLGLGPHLVREDLTVGAAGHHVPVVQPFSIVPDRAGEYPWQAIRSRSAGRLVTG